MRNSFRALLWVTLSIPLLSVGLCQAESVEFDTDSAHVIVVRPLDLWSGDASALESTLKSVSERRASYDVKLDGIRYRGSPVVFQGVSDNPVTKGVEAALQGTDARLASNDAYWFHVSLAGSMPPEAYAGFAKAQGEFYEQFVLRQGDPRELSGRVRARKIFGNILSIGSLLIPTHALGAGTGAQVMLNSGLAGDIGNLPGQARAALTPVELPALDLTGYKSVDIWKVEFKPDVPGEILIAYRVEKTPQVEQDALIRAIVTLTGADTTPEAVEKSRQDDFEKRVGIWDACVTRGECQKEVSNEPAK